MRLTIDRVTERGAGVGVHEGAEVHVHGAAPGDTVDATIEHVSPHRPRSFARLERVVTPGAARRAVPCPRSDLAGGRCGGCAWLHLTEPAQEVAGLRRVREAWDAHGLDPAVLPAEVRRAGTAAGWRNRSHRLAWRRGGTLLLGARARRGDRLADLSGCIVEQAPLPAVFDAVAAHADRLRVPTLASDGSGLRQVSARTNRAGEVLVELAVTSDLDVAPLVEAAMGVPGVVGVHVATLDGASNSTVAAARRHAAGAHEIVERCGPLAVPLGPSTFFQLNTAVAEAMYARAALWCAGASLVVDLYAGIGGLGVTIACGTGAAVDAREVHPGAIEAGAALAASVFVPWTGAVVDLEQAAVALPEAADRIVVNPPRRGLSGGVIAAARQRPDVPLLYMSCSPESLARDLAALGRPVRQVEVWAMMPGTAHVEVLVDVAPS